MIDICHISKEGSCILSIEFQLRNFKTIMQNKKKREIIKKMIKITEKSRKSCMQTIHK